MEVTFEPTGEKVQVGLGGAVAQRMATITSNPIYIETPSGTTPVEGTLVAGSSAAYPIIGAANGHFIGFYGGAGQTIFITKFGMDDADAVTAGLNAISAALVAETAAITLKADGTLGS